ncbi:MULTISPECIES: ASCH domain-containing protein [unclassified Bradyrhizobium]
MDEILISLKPRHADRIFDGAKTVELRKRRFNVRPGSRVWIYETTPTAAIRGYARLDRIEAVPPSQLWQKLGSKTGVSREEFETYFQGCKIAYGLVLADVMEMEAVLPLAKIREAIGNFHPPQFYCHLNGARKSMRLSHRKYRPIEEPMNLFV